MNLGQIKLSCAILVMMSMIPSGSCKNYWEEKELGNNEPRQKFEALITGSTYAWHGRYCGGIIINPRYILTIYACTRGDYGIAKDLKVYVGFSTISYLSDVPSDGTPYEVESVINMRDLMTSKCDSGYTENSHIFLAVISTKEFIKFGPNVGFAKVPKGPFLQYFDIKDAELSAVIYKRDETDKNKFQLKQIRGHRSCDPSKIKDIPIWLIPSCVNYKDPGTQKDKWWFPMGASLVHNDTLIGIKNHYSHYPGFPYESIGNEYSLYINIAYYHKSLELFIPSRKPK